MCISVARARGLAHSETSHTEILPRGSLYTDFAKRLPTEILCRDLAKRPLQEMSYSESFFLRGTKQRFSDEISKDTLYR